MIKKIAIVGFGLEGLSAYNFLTKKYPTAKIVIYDQSKNPKLPIPGQLEHHLGEIEFEKIDADLIVRTPAIDPNLFNHSARLTSVTKLFFEHCPAPIIGVTGSKGKGTTASLIASILKEAKKRVHLIGNIGVPALDELADIKAGDIVVYELSSFQLWDMDRSPNVAVVVHIEPDHLDVHANFEEYLSAKANIARFQTAEDVMIYDSSNLDSTWIAMQSKAGKFVAYPSKSAANFDQKSFYYNEQKICSIKELNIPGEHNLRNATAAIDAAMEFTSDLGAVVDGLRNFKGLEHRLKLVKTVKQVDYYDDSIATTVGSVRAAIRAIDKPKILIMGGSYKAAKFEELIDDFNDHQVKLVIAIGKESDRIEQSLRDQIKAKIVNFGDSKTMSEIVNYAASQAEVNQAVVLSPACASFGMFKDYKDRGNQFVDSVLKLEK